ncbi:MAG: T9SS type A sorting domain-containing protein [bacterium]
MRCYESWHKWMMGCVLAILICAAPLQSQIQIDTTVAVGDSLSRFWLQVPAGYDPAHPPALLVWWHQWGGDEHEMRNFTDFDGEANRRGWLAASHFGWCNYHWNNPLAQDYAMAMLGWIRENYPFDEDSLYFIGGSMGGAAGMVYHNNHCDSRDFFVAATASGSGIMDCYRRAMEYLAFGDTNRSMREVFGGLPWEAAYEYQRNSAVYFADTTYSMHFNSRHLPVLLTFGYEETFWKAHALDMDTVRQGWADTTYTFESPTMGHGLSIMQPPEICAWLSGFRANRYPDELSINGDEAGRYYWARIRPTSSDTTFARFEARKDTAQNQIHLAAIRHIASLEVDGDEIGLDFARVVSGYWRNSEAPNEMEVALVGIDEQPDSVTLDGEIYSDWSYVAAEEKLIVSVAGGGLFRVYPHGSSVDIERQGALTITRLIGNYPNPFNQSTCFLLEQSRPGLAALVVYNLLGQEIWKWSAYKPVGRHRILFDADALPSGIYFYRLESAPQPSIHRMMLVR